MKCPRCGFYNSGYMFNECSLTDGYCFKEVNDCDLVNDDGTVNSNNEYFKGDAT